MASTPLLDTSGCVSAIARHSAGFAEAARSDLTARVEQCPGWDVADLVWHLGDVQWFWATIVGERLVGPPDESRRPPRVPDDQLVDLFEQRAAHLVDVLRNADQSASCWTWAGWRQDVAFVTRHQVQEAAVHHFDAADAVGRADDWQIDPLVAADCVEEFLHFSVASEDDPDDPVTPPLHGTLALRCSDTGHAWTLRDGRVPGTAAVSAGAADGAPTMHLLLWLSGRRQPAGPALPDDLVARFRAICFTD